MRPRRQVERSSSAPERSEIFTALEHSLAVICLAQGCWTVSVDGGPISGTYRTQVEAWEAGVRAVDRQTR